MRRGGGGEVKPKRSESSKSDRERRTVDVRDGAMEGRKSKKQNKEMSCKTERNESIQKEE